MLSSARSPLRFFEAWADGAGALQTRNGVVPYDKLDAWLGLKAEYSVSASDNRGISDGDMFLRLISCDFIRHPFSLGCDDITFEQVRTAFKLHHTTKEAFLSNNGAYARYLMRSTGKEVDRLALVYKVPNGVNIAHDGLSLSYDKKIKTTRAFLHGLADDAHELLLNNLVKRKDQNHFQHPLFLPSHMIRRYQRQIEVHRFVIDKSIVKVEREVGYAISGVLEALPSRPPTAVQCDDILRRLHPCLKQVAVIAHACNFGLKFGELLQKLETRLQEVHFLTQDPETCIAGDEISHRIDFSINLYTTTLSQSNILRERAQNHTNLVFNLMAQEESHLNRSVAEKSALIALAAKKDSAAMKTIAVATIVFLPPTFVASFFSMSMFDWSPTSNRSTNPVASKYWWVYWAVAIPLTAIVLSIWRMWKVFEESRYQVEVLQTRSDLGMTIDFQQQDEAVAKLRARQGLREWATPGRTRFGSFELGSDWD